MIEKIVFIGGEKMMQFVFENTILDRLPMSLSGMTHISVMFAGGVCPKLNRFQKQSEFIFLT